MNLKTIYNGFWRFGTTGFIGRSHKEGYYIEESRTLFNTPKWIQKLSKYAPKWVEKKFGETWMYQSYGLQRHVPKHEPYKLSYILEVMEHFDIKVRIFNRDINGYPEPHKEYICTLATQVHPKLFENEYCMVDAHTKDGNYVGDLKWTHKLISMGIYKPECIYDNSNVVSVGYSKKDHKWYGWSHRALHGFTIGSKVKKGDCAYRPTTKQEYMDDCTRFWENEDHLNTYTKAGINELDDGTVLIGCWTHWTYSDKIKNKSLHGTISGVFSEFPVFGKRGEWTAETMDDAREMAIDFSNGVS